MTGLFESNLAALAARDPALAGRIEKVSPSDDIEIQTSPSGLVSATAAAPEGMRIALCSAREPKKEAARLVEAAGIRPADAVVAFGFGMGHHILEISEKIGRDGFLAVIEHDERVLAAALKHADFSRLFARENFRLCCPAGRDAVSEWLGGFVTELMLRKTVLFEHAPSVRLHPDKYRRSKEAVLSLLDSASSELVTKLAHAEEFFVNTWRNAPALVASPGVEKLFGKFRGRAAFTVAAGPSLDENAAGLARVPPSALIICVGTALKVLLERGIVPHIVAAVDPQEQSARYFDCIAGKPLRPEAALVCTTYVSPSVAGKFDGMKFFAWEDSALCNFFERFAGERANFKAGLSVAHAAFEVARMMGCDPIIMLGQDLGFSAGRTHAAGVEKTWGGEIDESDGRFIRLRANRGGTIASLPVFRAFLAVFERMISRTSARVINATAGGAVIEGAEHMTLEAAIACCPAGGSDAREIITQTYREFADSAPRMMASDMLKACENLHERAEGLRGTALRAAEIAEGRPTEEKIRELNGLLKCIIEEREVMPLLEDLMIKTYFALKRKTGAQASRAVEIERALTLARGTAWAAGVLLKCIEEYAAFRKV